MSCIREEMRFAVEYKTCSFQRRFYINYDLKHGFQSKHPVILWCTHKRKSNFKWGYFMCSIANKLIQRSSENLNINSIHLKYCGRFRYAITFSKISVCEYHWYFWAIRCPEICPKRVVTLLNECLLHFLVYKWTQGKWV